MISDEVEITTYSSDEEKARKISLRSVHGRYLVRLLDKHRDQEAIALAPHGTRVRLKVRSTARLGSVVQTMRQWIVLPRCDVTVSVDGAEPITVGFESAQHAIQDYLTEMGLNTDVDNPSYKVVTKQAEGVEFAYAARWSSHYKDWSIAHLRDRAPHPVPCTCVEGVAVIFATPGMNNRTLIAIANAAGSKAPKTNVARSTLESTPERDRLFSDLYGLYFDHVKDEIKRLIHEEHYSLTWAANNAVTLVPFSLMHAVSGEAALPNILLDHMKGLPIYVVERAGGRVNVEFNDLTKEDSFWTVDCQLVDSAEQLVKEAKSDATVLEPSGSAGR